MTELKRYFQKLKEEKKPIMVWTKDPSGELIGWKAYVAKVFLYEDKFMSLGLAPNLDVDYMEVFAFDEIVRFAVMSEEVYEEQKKQAMMEARYHKDGGAGAQ